MRTAFIGTVEGSRRGFEALVRAGHTPDLVVTLPGALASRHSDFADLTGPAREAGAEILTCSDINDASVVDAIRERTLDLSLVIGWSQICRAPFREAARHGAIGFHPAPLPRMRGRAVIPWTILAGEVETGATLFWLDEGADSGDILLQRTYPVAPDETARTLYDRHVLSLEAMLPEAVALVAAGCAPRRPQDASEATWCAKRTAEDGHIDWRAPAAAVFRLIRAVGEPYPGAFTRDRDRLIIIDQAALPTGPCRYVGLPGQVQSVSDDRFAVMCGDGNCVEILAWRAEPAAPPRLHAKLG